MKAEIVPAGPTLVALARIAIWRLPLWWGQRVLAFLRDLADYRAERVRATERPLDPHEAMLRTKHSNERADGQNGR